MKKIFITTDIHNYMSYSLEHQKGFYNETKQLEEYLKLANKYNIKVTAFCSGKVIEENIETYEKLIRLYGNNIEIGGHTYDCYISYIKGEGLIYKLLYGSILGPSWKQNKDIKKTTDIIYKLGVKPLSWRTHAYSSNKITRKILKKYGYNSISDLSNKKYISNIIKEIPPNSIPDHENIKHPDINVHKNATMSPDQRLTVIKKTILNENNTVILAHATCQKYIDNFETLEKLFKWIDQNNFKTYLMKDYEKKNLINNRNKGISV